MRDIAATLGCAAPPGDLYVTGVANLTEAGPQDISFLGSEALLKEFNASGAGAVLVQRNLHVKESSRTIVLRVDDADLAMAKVLESFAPPRARPAAGVDARACVDPTARIGQDVSIGAFCVVGPGAQIGRGSVIHPQVYIGQDVEIGQDCEIFPNVTIRERILIGSRVIINAGSVLGTDGFGYRWDGSKQAKIPQIGNVVVEDDVDIGSCVCIDRAKFSSTRIGRGTKIDNLVQIAHNVTIGENCLVIAQVGIAGSTKIGNYVTLAGQVGIAGHLKIGDQAIVAAKSGVMHDIPDAGKWFGIPAQPNRQAKRQLVSLQQLPELIRRVKELEEWVKRPRGKTKAE